jgi:hypothetical protein
MARSLRIASSAAVLMLAVGCFSQKTYFGPSSLQTDPPLRLIVEPLDGQRSGAIRIRLSLANLSAETGKYCFGYPWSYSATVNGKTDGYDPLVSAGGICESGALVIEPQKTVGWDDKLVFDGTPAEITDLSIEVRVYPLSEKGVPERKRFYVMSARWTSAEA